MTDTAPVSGPDLPSMPTLHAHPDEKIITTWGVLRKYMNDAAALQSDNTRLIAENEGLRHCLTKSDMMRHDRTLEIATLRATVETLRDKISAVVTCGKLAEQACESGVAIMGPRAEGYKRALGALGNSIEALAQSAEIEGRKSSPEGDETPGRCFSCGAWANECQCNGELP